jgi:hypothetical protein
VLLQIKKDFNNPYLLSSWDPKTPCCGWYHIQCDEITNRVISIAVSDWPEYTNFNFRPYPLFGR